MSNKKKGFTLIEVLVVMLIATIVFSMVGGAMVFITTTTENYIHQSEEIDMAKNIENYLRNCATEIDDINLLLTDNENALIRFNQESGDLLNDGNAVFSNTGLTSFSILSTGDFIKCQMKYESGREFEFILGSVQTGGN